MRFLLQPTTQRLKNQGLHKSGKTSSKKGEKNLPALSVFASSDNVAVAKNNTEFPRMIETWGQQCSPSCGCVVRFEATLDPGTNRYVSASYHAKSVVVTRKGQKNGTLEPALTLRNNRPMFRSCTCKSLHKLARRVTEHLPNQNALSLGSNMEFSGVRSSPAFRHTVLERQGLSNSDTHCFDVVEEALTAMVKGHMLKPREQISLKELFANMENSPYKFEKQGGEATEDEDVLRFDMSNILAAPRAMSALRLLDVNAEYSPFSFDKDTSDSQSRSKNKRDTEPSPKKLDWVTYVDELYEKDVYA